MHEVTLKDIAKVVGYSVNTVSLALKDSPRISEDTRKKIQAVAKEMDYTVNNMARALVLKKTGTIGLVIRNISSLLLTSEARYIERYLEQNGYTMYIIASHDDLKIEEKAINLMLSNKVDGLILNTRYKDNLPKVERLRAQGFPVVLISGFSDYKPKVDTVYPDLAKGAYIATKHLLNMGHKRVVFVGGTKDKDGFMDEKCLGYIKAMEESQIEITSDLFCALGQKNFELLEDRALGELLRVSKRESAIFVDHDELAIPITKFLSKNNIKIPQDLAVVSMDNVRFSESAAIPLTTVGYDLRYMSHHAVDMLLEIINGTCNEDEYENIGAEPEFFIRESCGYYQI